MEPVEFGNGLRSHIAREPEAVLSDTPLGPVPRPVPVRDPVPPPASGEWVRDLLRARAGEQADRIWAVFEEALGATGPDGRPDHALRLQAARALLAEVYGPAEARSVPVPDDELGRLRLAKGLP